MESARVTSRRSRLEVVDLGRMEYGAAYAKQVDAVEAVLKWREQDDERAGIVFLLEHDPPVITISRRPDARKHLIADEAKLQRAGVTLAETDRGGDITYHGPGQLVAYPIIDLNRCGLNLHGYMRLLEQIVIDVLAELALTGERDREATGVWVGGAKICAMGVRVRRWVSMHGFALNISTDLSHFDLIVPCGLAGRTVTSIQRELGGSAPSMAEMKIAIARQFRRAVESRCPAS